MLDTIAKNYGPVLFYCYWLILATLPIVTQRFWGFRAALFVAAAVIGSAFLLVKLLVPPVRGLPDGQIGAVLAPIYLAYIPAVIVLLSLAVAGIIAIARRGRRT
jgi:hypothetical protein